MTEPQIEQFVYWTDTGETCRNLGDDRLNLHTAARAAIQLAAVVERVRERHLDLAGKRADAALQRRFGQRP